MKAPLILLAHSIKRVRTLILVMGAVLALFQVFLIVIGRSLDQSNAFEQLSAIIPPFIRQLMGPTFTSFMSFKGVVSLGYFHLAIMGSLLGLSISVATMPASEVETGFMDLILARPLARHLIITRSILLLTICIIISLSMMMLGTWAGLNFLAAKQPQWPEASLILSLAANLAALMLCWGGIALLIGSTSRRRAVAGSITGLLALTSFLLDYVARAWQPAEAVAWLSPFRYYSPLDIVTANALNAQNVLVLLGVALASFAVAYLLFSRRDI
jgi:ABC-2 type transport system permease protein